MSAADSPLGVYVHIPYCPAVCPYCDFNVAVRKDPPWDAFAKAVVNELDSRRSAFTGSLQSIYFGGGTPSLAPPSVIASIIEGVRDRIHGQPREVTLEANPGTVTRASLDGYRAAGVTRVSLGWQSTHDRLLQLLGRTHSAHDSHAAAIAVKAAGFDAMSIDLIFAVPGQTIADLDADLDAVLALSPQHVSLYGLTYHAGTPFERARARGAITPVDDDSEAAMFEHIAATLRSAGYAHYEISNFAKPGFDAVHNGSYWAGTPYIGLGPGAHSFVREQWQRGWRWENVRNPDRYIKTFTQRVDAGRPQANAPDVTFVEELDAVELVRERVLTGLRLERGIDLKVAPFVEHDLSEGAHEAVASGLAVFEDSRLIPTMLGRLRADDLAVLVAP